MIKHILIFYIFFFCIPQMLQSSAQELGLQASPAKIYLTTKSSETIKRSIKISNPTKEALQIRLQTSPIKMEKNTGRILFDLQDSNTLRFIESAVSISENNEPISTLKLLPNEETTIDVLITPPTQGNRDYSFSLVLLASTEHMQQVPTDPLSAQTTLQAGIVVPILLSINPIPSHPQITIFETNRLHTTGSIPFTLHVVNPSNHFVTFEGAVEIKNIFGHIVEKIQLRKQTLLANSEVSLEQKDLLSNSIKRNTSISPKIVSSLSSMFGKYTAVVILKTPGSAPIMSTTTFYIIPYKAFMLIAFVSLVIYIIKKRMSKLDV